MFLSDLSVRRPVFTTMLVLAFVVLGIFGYLRLSVDLMPDVDFPFVTITTIYPGAGPEEIESQITKRIEDAVSTLAGVDLMESISRESVSFVIMRFELERDSDDAANDVRARVDAILNDLPEGAEKPQVLKFEIGAFPIISLSVSSDRGVNQTFALADETVRDRLAQVSGVATIDIIGGQKREIQVAVDRRKLDYYNLPISAVTRAVAMENMNVPEGRIIEPEQEFTIRTLGQFASVEEIACLRIPLPGGGFISLKDIAIVRDTFEEARSGARFNGQEAVQVDVVKRAGANTIDTADGIYKAVEELRKELPPDFVIEYARDSSVFIRDTVEDVLQNILIGILLTSVLLYVFLRNVRVTLVAAVVMPSAIISSFLLIQASGFTINMLTLMALGISVGVLVTNSIIVIENIVRHLQKGKAPDEAAMTGTNEVALAVVASVMTNIVVFVPIAFMRGIVGRFFLQFGMTVVFATIFSLIISFTLTPMLSSVVLKRMGGRRDSKDESRDEREGQGVPRHWMDRRMNSLAESYRGLLTWSLARARNRSFLMLATVVMFFLGLVLIGVSGGEFMPRIDQGTVYVAVKLPAGSSLRMTERSVIEIENILAAEPDVVSILSTIGGAGRGVNEATVLAKLVDISRRDRSAYQMSNDLRPKLAGVPGVDISVAGGEQEGGSSGDLEIEVMGDELETLKGLTSQVLAIVASIPGLVDVESSWEEGGEELVFIPDREEMARRDLSTGLVAALLRNSFEGDDSSVFREGGEEYAIRVQFDDEDRQDQRTLEEIRIAAGEVPVPLTQLGRVEKQRGEAEILRRERQRRITVRANIAEGTVSEAVSVIRARTDQLALPPGYRIKFAGEYEFQEESFAAIFEALILAIILTYVVLAMILESFIHPITVMITLPLGLVGSAIGLFFGGQTINLMSLMAMVMLVGIVVNNAILLLDYVGQLRRRGRGLEEAIVEGCPVRLRAVIMTNLAIAVGMIPQALGTGAGFEYRTAMAVVTMGGVLVSAFFTLVIIPSLYYSFEQIMAKIR
ncbi:MAG: efflux RND transporter permease subunit [Candidatus Eisenbacteria sp.]|nr:efflux RND transporter permease subunit [Candidatus Eisenbacteria bacterium]